MKKFNIQFFSYSLVAKLATFFSTLLIAGLQKKFDSSVDLANITILFQWISLASIFDFGVVNWINSAKTQNLVERIYSVSSLYSGIIFSFIFTIFFICTIKLPIGEYAPIFLILYAFTSYLIFLTGFYLLKKEKYFKSLVFQSSMVIPQSIFFAAAYYSYIKIDFLNFIIFDLLFKLPLLLLVKYHIYYDFKKYINLVSKSSRFVFIQLCSYIQYGCDLVLFFYFFNSQEYNQISASYRYLQAPLFLMGMLTSYLINYSGSFRYKNLPVNLIAATFIFQIISFYVLSYLFNNNTQVWMYIYIISLSLLSYLNTKLSIDRPNLFLRYIIFTTIPVIILKLLFFPTFKLKGLLFIVFAQLLLYFIYSLLNSNFIKKL